MIIFPYPKPTKCYGDTVIRRAVQVAGMSCPEKFVSIP